MTAIVVTLDSIFDTRTALWGRLLEPEQLEGLLNDNYYTRMTDVYPDYYDPLAFRALYDKRDVELLKESYITQVLDLVYDLYKRAHAKAVAGPGEEHPYIVVSTYPYTLTEGEISDIAACMAECMSKEVDIRFVNRSTDVGREDLRAMKAMAFVTYEGERWLAKEYETDVTPETILPFTLLITPLLKTALDPLTDEEIEKAAMVFKDDLASIICRFEWTAASVFTTVMLNPQVVGAQSLMAHRS